ncbi:MAG: N-acetyltransferase [Clostridia bacterium]|nr:N-acetyltransferase [Clostridia bacterium]
MIEIKFEKDQNKSIALDNNTQIGECEFIEQEGTWNIVHTEVNNLYQGQGIARKLVECVLENAKKYNKNVVADCSYAKRVIEKNKE